MLPIEWGDVGDAADLGRRYDQLQMTKRVAVAAALASLIGCSTIFMDTVPDGWKGRTDPRCTTSSALPVLDLILTTGNAVALFGLGLSPETLPVLADMLIFGFSSAVGFGNASECSKAYEKYETWQRDDEDEDEEIEQIRRQKREDKMRRQIRAEERRELELERLRNENERLRQERDAAPSDAGVPDVDATTNEGDE